MADERELAREPAGEFDGFLSPAPTPSRASALLQFSVAYRCATAKRF
jgi:hypothetical protein